MQLALIGALESAGSHCPQIKFMVCGVYSVGQVASGAFRFLGREINNYSDLPKSIALVEAGRAREG
jgi:hypothetical protein